MDPFEKRSEQGGLLSFGNTKSQLGLSQKSRQGERGPGRKIKGFTYSWVKDYHNNSKFPWNRWLERRGGNSQHEVTGEGALTEIAHTLVLQGITAWTPQEAVQTGSKLQQEVSLNATSLIFSLHTLPCLSPGPVPHLQLSSPCEHQHGVSPSAQGGTRGCSSTSCQIPAPTRAPTR